jgi:hypothetical protein
MENHLVDFCLDLPVNGEVYATLEGGHDTQAIPENRAYFPQGWPTTGLVLQPVALQGTEEDKRILCRRFILINTYHMTHLDPVWRPTDTPEERLINAYKVSLIRLAAALQGLAAPHFDAQLNYAHYSDCVVANGELVEAANAWYQAVPQVPLDDLSLTCPYRILARAFNTLMGITAFVFRTRGHHFKEAFIQIMNTLLQGATLPEHVHALVPDHSVYAGPGLHCVFPSLLDAYWMREADAGRMPGNLKKRIQCAASGQASAHTISQGINDITTCLPGLKSVLSLNLADFQNWAALLREPGARWHLAINRNLYPPTNAELLEEIGTGFSEGELASVAATVMSVYRQFAETSTGLLNKALKIPDVTQNTDLKRHWTAMTGLFDNLLYFKQFTDVQKHSITEQKLLLTGSRVTGPTPCYKRPIDSACKVV